MQGHVKEEERGGKGRDEGGREGEGRGGGGRRRRGMFINQIVMWISLDNVIIDYSHFLLYNITHFLQQKKFLF